MGASIMASAELDLNLSALFLGRNARPESRKDHCEG